MVHFNGKSAFAAVVAAVLLLPIFALAQRGTISEVEQIRAKAMTLSSGRVTVSVELKDGRSYKGVITGVEGEDLVLLDPNAGREVRIRYESVAKLRKRGMSSGVRTAIWISVAAGIGALIIFGPKSRPIDTICPISCRK
jgi:small nuclear ribonucleoprotein (snRNP)-like protein